MWPVVRCPGCQVPMDVKQVTPDAPGAASGMLIYICGSCGTETVRHHKGAELLKARETEKS